ncbi:unnamed protein product, partial [Hapterophycus canaliculatus]
EPLSSHARVLATTTPLRISLACSQELFRDESRTEFVVVTIPSILAVAETERLFEHGCLVQEVPVKHVVVNKVVEESVQEGYVQRLSKGQAAGVDQLEQ